MSDIIALNYNIYMFPDIFVTYISLLTLESEQNFGLFPWILMLNRLKLSICMEGPFCFLVLSIFWSGVSRAGRYYKGERQGREKFVMDMHKEYKGNCM